MNKNIYIGFMLIALLSAFAYAYPVGFEVTALDGAHTSAVYHCTTAACEAVDLNVATDSGSPTSFTIPDTFSGNQFFALYTYKEGFVPQLYRIDTADNNAFGPHPVTIDFTKNNNCYSNIPVMTVDKNTAVIGEQVTIDATVQSVFISGGIINVIPAEIENHYSNPVDVFLYVNDVLVDSTQVTVVWNEFEDVQFTYVPTTAGSKNIEVRTRIDNDAECTGTDELMRSALLTVEDPIVDTDVSVDLITTALSGTAPLTVNAACDVLTGNTNVAVSLTNGNVVSDTLTTLPDGVTNAFTYSTAGTFTITCTATDADGDTDTETATVTVTAPLPQCDDDIDNDLDGLIDHEEDPGCDDELDDDEFNDPIVHECQVATQVDDCGAPQGPFEACIGLTHRSSTITPTCIEDIRGNKCEDPHPVLHVDTQCNLICHNTLGCDYTQCSDGEDNDLDGDIDLVDLGCDDAYDDDESDEDAPVSVELITTPLSGLAPFSVNAHCNALSGNAPVTVRLINGNTVTDIFNTLPNGVSNSFTYTTPGTFNILCEGVDADFDADSKTVTVTVIAPQCDDDIDNDLDGTIDHEEDAGCDDRFDNDESDGPVICSDSLIDCGAPTTSAPECNGLTHFTVTTTPTCMNPGTDASECVPVDTTNEVLCNNICSDTLGCDYTQCSDGVDNDLDGDTDLEDLGCDDHFDDDESNDGDLVISITTTPSEGTAPLTVRVQCTVSAGDAPAQVSIDFGDGRVFSQVSVDSIPGSISVDNIYDTEGTYFPTCIIEDADGDSESVSVPVTVSAPECIIDSDCSNLNTLTCVPNTDLIQEQTYSCVSNECVADAPAIVQDCSDADGPVNECGEAQHTCHMINNVAVCILDEIIPEDSNCNSFCDGTTLHTGTCNDATYACDDVTTDCTHDNSFCSGDSLTTEEGVCDDSSTPTCDIVTIVEDCTDGCTNDPEPMCVIDIDTDVVVDLVTTPLSGVAPFSVTAHCDVLSGNAPAHVQLTNGNTVASLLGTLPDGVSNTFTYTTVGVFSIVCQATDADGDSDFEIAAVTVVAPECNDGIDNDLDGAIDHDEDPGCDDEFDNDESNGPIECSDSLTDCGEPTTVGTCEGQFDLTHTVTTTTPTCINPGKDTSDCVNETVVHTTQCNNICSGPIGCDFTQCSDGIDNDLDGSIDFGDDIGCDDFLDNDETDPVVLAACEDGVDNDGDGHVDDNDPGCSSTDDNNEDNGEIVITQVDALNAQNDIAEGSIVQIPVTRDELLHDVTVANTFFDTELEVETIAHIVALGLISDDDDDEIDPQDTEVFFNDFDNFNLVPGVYEVTFSAVSEFEGDPLNDSFSYFINVTTQCNDGIDNDNDGAVDFPADFACENADDNNEGDVLAACQDGQDNDNDGEIDHGDDPGCDSPQDNDEFNDEGVLVALGASPLDGEAPHDVTVICDVLEGNLPIDVTVSLGDGTEFDVVLDDVVPDAVTIEHTYLAAGDYPIGCTATDVDGDSDFEGVIVSVDEPGPVELLLLEATFGGVTLSENVIVPVKRGTHDATTTITATGFFEDVEVFVFIPTITNDFSPIENMDDGDIRTDSFILEIPASVSPGPVDYFVSITDVNGLSQLHRFPLTVLAQCEDDMDNDNDGLIDLADPGCDDASDDDETDEIEPQCIEDADCADLNTIVCNEHAIVEQTYSCVQNECVADAVPTPVEDCSQRNGINNECGVFEWTCDDVQPTVECVIIEIVADDSLCANTCDGDTLTQGVCNDVSYACETTTVDCSAADATYCSGGAIVTEEGFCNDSADPVCDVATAIGDCLFGCEENPEPVCSEPTPQCQDGIDNDLDGLTDLDDPGCVSPTDDDESDGTSECQDGIDNDGDLLIDFGNDPGCDSPQDNIEGDGTSQCQDGLDNDQDGLIDGNDPGCADVTDDDESDGTSQCQDGVDNDSDGLIDLADPGCDTPQDNSEDDPIRQCNDGIDNDGDTMIDLADPGCSSPLDDNEGDGTPQCQDAIDNDGDGLVDGDDPGCGSPQDNDEFNAFEPGFNPLVSEDADLSVQRITIHNNAEVEAGDIVFFTFRLRNSGDVDLDEVRVQVGIPELGIVRRIGPFSVNDGTSTTKTLGLDVPPGTAPGEYMVRTIVWDEETKRVQHRPIMVW